MTNFSTEEKTTPSHFLLTSLNWTPVEWELVQKNVSADATGLIVEIRTTKLHTSRRSNG
jgi:hypothetical protein